MSDLIERLRKRRMPATNGAVSQGHKLYWVTDHIDPDCAEAADEIERLRAEGAV